ncbi:MAG: phosphoribosylanthranilate isomerase [Bacteroidales bacterium]|jgi:phosphoribosylanthranilate isomerase|nr:phosphoribosylanthranilate isomerase [Bacteroidales bacterium]
MKIKVCGMKHPHNIQELLQHNPDFIGFIFYEKSPRFFGDSCGIIDTNGIVETHGRASQPETTKKIGVFVNETVENILKIAEKYHLDGIQFHGKESPEECLQIREKGLLTIKAFNVENKEDFEQTKPYEYVVDFFLFDTRLPPAPSEGGRAYGGTGIKFDWQILKQYKGETPFFLSGGISESDAETIKSLHLPQLYAVDINSRFEIEPGLKHIENIKKFITHIRN